MDTPPNVMTNAARETDSIPGILRQQFAAVRRLDEPLRKGGGELSALVEGR